MKSVKEHEYTTYPRRFESYRWYKPFLVGFKIVFVAFIIFADKKLHWFDEVKKDDVTAFNMKRRA